MEEIREGYTRVSEIVGWFKANELAKIDPDTLRKKCELGTNVHSAIAQYEEGVYVPLDEKEEGYFKSFLKWNEDAALLVQHSEQRFYCDELKVTGAIDCVGIDMETAKPYIIDFKTSATKDLRGWALQGAFYHHLATVNQIYVAPTVRFIQLDKNGEKPTVHDFPITSLLKVNMMKCWEVYHLWHLSNKEIATRLY